MPELFGPEHGGNEGAAKQPNEPAGPDYVREGEPTGNYFQYDNEMGGMVVNLPPRFAKYKADLHDDLMDAFMGEAAGGKDQAQTIDAWIADWIERKEAEDAGG